MKMSSVLEQIESLNLSGAEVNEVVQALIRKERTRSRNDAPQIVALLVAMLKVAEFDDKSIIADAEALQLKIRAT
jgi:hypothetical protein